MSMDFAVSSATTSPPGRTTDQPNLMTDLSGGYSRCVQVGIPKGTARVTLTGKETILMKIGRPFGT